MQKKPKEKRKIEKEKSDEQERSSWSEDQKKREYYYDDAHGYKTYDPDHEEDEIDDEQSKKVRAP